MMTVPGHVGPGQTHGSEPMNAEQFSSIKPVCDIRADRHGHHDVLAGVLDAFATLCQSESERWLLARCVATKLLYCKCEEGRRIRKAIRGGAGCPDSSNVPLVIVEGTHGLSLAGRPAYNTTRGGKLVRNPRAYMRKGRVVYHRSTRHIQVTTDVVLAYAGMQSLLPAVIPVALANG